MCGEKFLLDRFSLSVLGSPPHVRGKAMGIPRGALMQGITPACAGKSTGGFDANKCPQDHPRMCGEKL